MQVFNFSILLRGGGHSARRFNRLRRLLDKIGDDIDAERDALGNRYENATASAAFAFEAMENGESPQRISAQIDALTASIIRCAQRLDALEHEGDFIDSTRRRLGLLLGTGDRR